jgi:hypothetical protein
MSRQSFELGIASDSHSYTSCGEAGAAERLKKRTEILDDMKQELRRVKRRGAQLWIGVLTFAGLFVLFWLSGVGSDATGQRMTVSAPHPDLQDGKAFWNGVCVACHGANGMGASRVTQRTPDIMPVVTFPCASTRVCY